MRTRARRWHRLVARKTSDRGASAVELTLLTPVMLLATFLIISFALWFDARHAALAAAQEGDLVAREEAGNPNLSLTWERDANSTANRFYDGLDTSALTNVNASSGFTNAAVGGLTVTDVQVTVSGSLNWIWHIKITETVTGPEECFHTEQSGGTQCP